MNIDLINEIRNHSDLLKVIRTAPSIDIIEYDARSVEGTMSILKLLDTDSRRNETRITVVLAGELDPALIDRNEKALRSAFPALRIIRHRGDWRKLDFEKIWLEGILTLHMLFDTDISIQTGLSRILSLVTRQHNIFSTIRKGESQDAEDVIKATRNAYYAAFIKSGTDNLFESPIKVICRLTLEDLNFSKSSVTPKEPSVFCTDKQEYMGNAIKNVADSDAFFICMDEMETGCTECSQCRNYHPAHHCPIAQCHIADFYRKGVFIEKNPVIAHQWYLKASRQAYIPAKLQVADDLLEGSGCDKDVHKAIHTFADFAQYAEFKHLADKLIGIVMSDAGINDSHAIRYIAMKANDLDEDSVNRLIEAFDKGELGLPKDPVQKQYWENFLRHKIIEAPLTENQIDTTIQKAESGNLQAQIKLCNEYWNGRVLKKDFGQCAYWGEKAIEQGDRSVRFMVAYSSAVLGYETRAYFLYSQLAEEGNICAMNNLACLEKDPVKEVELFKKAADLNDEVAQYNIANKYRNGVSVEQSYENAFHYYQLSANNGYPNAMVQVAEMYRLGQGVEKDSAKMLEWYEKAAKRNYTEALLKLASVYRYGQSVEKDKNKALEYYQQAVHSDSSQEEYDKDSTQVVAMYQIGSMHENGECGTADLHKAVFWYRKAALHGNDDARRALMRLKLNWINKAGETVSE